MKLKTLALAAALAATAPAFAARSLSGFHRYPDGLLAATIVTTLHQPPNP